MREQKIHFLVKGIGLWIVGALAIMIPLSRVNLTQYWRLKHGVLSHGVVTGLEPGNHQAVRYTYQVGKEIHSGVGRAGFGNPEFCCLAVGQQVIVYYLPENPSESCVGILDELIKNETSSIALTGVIFPLFAMVGFSYRYPPFKRWLLN
jgi:hypothetical protein